MSNRVRIAESAGMALSRLLPSTNLWVPGDCGRQDCVVCSQQDDRQQDCRRGNVLCNNQCQACKVYVQRDGNKKDGSKKDGKGTLGRRLVPYTNGPENTRRIGMTGRKTAIM